MGWTLLLICLVGAVVILPMVYLRWHSHRWERQQKKSRKLTEREKLAEEAEKASSKLKPLSDDFEVVSEHRSGLEPEATELEVQAETDGAIDALTHHIYTI